MARWIRRTAEALAGVPGGLAQVIRQKNSYKSNWVMRPSGATPVNVSTARHRRDGDDTVLPESCSGFATGDGAAMGCSCRKWVPRTEQRVIAFTTKSVQIELGPDIHTQPPPVIHLIRAHYLTLRCIASFISNKFSRSACRRPVHILQSTSAPCQPSPG